MIHVLEGLQSFFAKHQITQMTQTPYNPNLAPCNFWFFPKLKSRLKGKLFQTIDEIQENMTGQLMAIPTKDFTECFEQWKRHWENCVRSQCAYFEGGLRHHCPMYNVCIFNKCLFFICTTGYFLDSSYYLFIYVCM